MPKATGKARKVQTTRGKAASRLGRPTFTCTCTGGCQGRTRELSEALFKRHDKFRELDKANDKGNADDLVSSALNEQVNIEYEKHNQANSESVSYQTTNLKFERY